MGCGSSSQPVAAPAKSPAPAHRGEDSSADRLCTLLGSTSQAPAPLKAQHQQAYGGQAASRDEEATQVWSRGDLAQPAQPMRNQQHQKPQTGVLDDMATVVWSTAGTTKATSSAGGNTSFGYSAPPSHTLPTVKSMPDVPEVQTHSPEPEKIDKCKTKRTTISAGASDSDDASGVSGAHTSASSKRLSAGEFPNKMAPLDIVPTGFRAGDFAFDMGEAAEGGASTKKGPASWNLEIKNLGFAARRFLTTQLSDSVKTVGGSLSEVHHITLNKDELAALGIVEDARLFAFTYPIVTDVELKINAKDTKNADIALLVFGGFMYFDSDMVLQDVRAVVPSEDGSGLHFGPPQPWAPEWTPTLSGDNRWKQVTIPALRTLGVRYFTWLLPDEGFGKNGGFAYLFHEPKETGVLQASFDCYFQIEDEEVSHGKGCEKCSRLLDWSDFSGGGYETGWSCENYDSCKQCYSEDNRFRWFCPQCQTDFCEACYQKLGTDGQARTQLRNKV